MKVYPAGRGRDVYRNIDDFIDEHLYEFCMDNRMYSEDAYQSDPEGDEPSTDIILDIV